LAAVDEILTPDFVQHAPGRDVKGIDAFTQYVMAFRSAFPDLHFTIEDQFAEGEKVVTHWTATGTHKGELMSITATDKHITLRRTTITRFAGARIAENLLYRDRFGFLEQLGVASK
jgi:steroid delta-isomerase-like uncharacterized protein